MNWLDELEALAKAITPGPYVMSKGPFLAEVRSTHPVNGRNYSHYQRTADAEYDAALRNAAPRLIAIARAAESLHEALSQIQWGNAQFSPDSGENGTQCDLCPMCDQSKARGHAPDCLVGMALRKALEVE